MFDLTGDQLLQLEQIRQDEMIERLILELRQENPAWLERTGLRPTIRLLHEMREEAWAFGIHEPAMVERFLRHGLTFTDFHKQAAFIEFMNRPVADTPEQRFRDYQSVVEFKVLMQQWREHERARSAK
ncbi:hypothetical protein K8U54_10120 [Pseudomonas fulva]|uniref:hypothetical protein n=1 Tax=Pseudomonas fulva TaxID=47880 RepID=UPI00201E4CC3|nr:hypothetical protein [Pseudomonas fulva]UQY36810.1 hypothetical protein K8U54_10120 [Pseudomonas fulva]